MFNNYHPKGMKETINCTGNGHQRYLSDMVWIGDSKNLPLLEDKNLVE